MISHIYEYYIHKYLIHRKLYANNYFIIPERVITTIILRCNVCFLEFIVIKISEFKFLSSCYSNYLPTLFVHISINDGLLKKAEKEVSKSRRCSLTFITSSPTVIFFFIHKYLTKNVQSLIVYDQVL